ncbi:carboxypeptidase-like regulatory domain-containing protein [Hymenobacter ruber]
MRLLLLLCICLWSSLAFSQTTISGRVLDAKSGDGLPGVTVLQTATINGTSSDAQGYFSFTVPEQSDSVALTVSSIGYVTRRFRVAAGNAPVTVRLAVDLKPAPVCCFAPAWLQLSLLSGVRYAPVGASVLLDGSACIRVPLTATASYQTNFARNHALHIGLGLPSIRRFRAPSITENLDYQQLRVPAANTVFDSYTADLGFYLGYLGGVRLPTFVLGTGYARWRQNEADLSSTSTGYGYTFGLRFSAFPAPFNVYASAKATHWPTYWQWQGSLTHGLPRNFQAGVALNQVRNYTELSLLLTRYFY